MEIKPCPFCGSDAVSVQGPGLKQVECRKCDACGPIADTPDEAITKWNQARVNAAQQFYDEVCAADKSLRIEHVRHWGTVTGNVPGYWKDALDAVLKRWKGEL